MACVSEPKYTRVGSSSMWYRSSMDRALHMANPVNTNTGIHRWRLFNNTYTAIGTSK